MDAVAATRHAPRQLPLGLALAPAVEDAAFGLCQDALGLPAVADPVVAYRLVLHLLYERLARALVPVPPWTHPDPAYDALRHALAEPADRAAREILAVAGPAAPDAPDALWTEFAGLYAPLLDRQPWRDPASGLLRMGSAVGGERKDSGSYYTPDFLVDCLLDSALEPVLARAAAAPDPVAAVLALRVCDPSCGSGQFLLGAARRLARHAPIADVVAGCLYGVDTDATAVEICRVALCLEAGDPALHEALERRIRRGNSLIGATAALEASGIPDAAYTPLAGDDPAVCKTLENAKRGLEKTERGPLEGRDLDAWCAEFVRPRTALEPAPGEVSRLAAEFGFFHWDLEFPDIHARGGFDVLLGNPPWERIKLQEKEWFALRAPDIAAARNAAQRGSRIAALAAAAPDLLAAFQAACRRAEAESHFLRNSGRFPLCGRGDVNAYTVFAETFRALLHPRGRAGFIVPAGLATDYTSRDFFRTLMNEGSLASFLVFENRRGLFPAVDSRVQFALVTLTGRAEPAATTDFLFYAHQVADLADHGRRIDLSAADLALLNPDTRTCPVFRTRREADLVRAIYRRVPVFIREVPRANPWEASFCRMFDMANDSGRFHPTGAAPAERGAPRIAGGDTADSLPLYEAKLLHQFDHRWATFEAGNPRLVRHSEKADPHFRIAPRYRVPAADVAARLGDRPDWLLAFRDIARATDERTAMAAVLPLVAVSHHAPLLRTEAPAPLQACLVANVNAMALDFVARTKVGGTHLTFFIVKQLPILPPDAYSPADIREIARRVVELVYTSPDLAPFARACGFDGPPFRWDAGRRFQLRCELDARYFQLYGLSAAEAADILDAFPILRRKDIAAHGEYLTRRRILELLD